MNKSEWFQFLLMVAMGLILVLVFASNVTSADEPEAPAYEIINDEGARTVRIRENPITGDLEVLDDEGKRLYRVRKASLKSDSYEVVDNTGKRLAVSTPRYIGDKRD